MTSFDDLFPNREECYLTLFQDVVYEHDDSFEYRIEEGRFRRRDKVAVIRRVKDFAESVYQSFVAQDASFSRCRPQVDYTSLMSVFARYSRDIYGFRRIQAKIRDIGSSLDENVGEQLEQIILDGADFGFKVPSGNPYIERQAAVLLYWFSVLKPFHLNFNVNVRPVPEPQVLSYFNEYFSYFLVCLALHTQGVDLVIHEDEEMFKEFLNQLHFRNLSRSSLEFFLPGKKA